LAIWAVLLLLLAPLVGQMATGNGCCVGLVKLCSSWRHFRPKGAASRPLLQESWREWMLNPEQNPEELEQHGCQAVFVFFKLLHWESAGS